MIIEDDRKNPRQGELEKQRRKRRKTDAEDERTLRKVLRRHRSDALPCVADETNAHVGLNGKARSNPGPDLAIGKQVVPPG